MDGIINVQKTLGRYEIRSELGSGAMATVYRAFDPEIKRDLAIKVLRAELAEDEEHRERFLREAHSAGSLNHDNIVQIFDIGETNNHPYIAMEILEGRTLQDILAESGTYSVEDAISVGIDLAKGLSEAHSKGVVHRDIKPSNIVITNNGRVKITDFGIARLESLGDGDRTRIGTQIGTPRYMSPEQVRARADIDGRSDLFSLGVILYQMLSGKQPFDGPTEGAVFVSIAQDEPDPLKVLLPDIPTALDKVVSKLLRKDPTKRYQTGTRLEEDLKTVLRSVRAHRRQDEERKVTPLRLKWTAVIGGALTIAMILGLSILQKRQRQEMAQLSYEYGSSLSNFIARESIEPIQLGIWAAIEVYVEQTSERQDLVSLDIIGPDNIVRGSTDAARVGQAFSVEGVGEPSALIDNTQIFEQETVKGQSSFLSVTPIESRGRTLGQVRLAMPLDRVENLSSLAKWMMTVLAFVVIGIASMFAYIMANQLTQPIIALREAISHLISSGFVYRIEGTRNDEFGVVFEEFNNMADQLRRMHGESSDQVSDVLTDDDDSLVLDDSRISEPADVEAVSPVHEPTILVPSQAAKSATSDSPVLDKTRYAGKPDEE